MIPYFRIGLVLSLLLATALIIYKYNDAVETATELELQLEAQSKELAQQTEELRSLIAYNGILNATLKEKQSYEDAIRTQLGGINRKLNQLMRDDPKVQEWGNMPLPDAVRGLLQDGVPPASRQGSVPASAGSPAPTHSRSRPTTESGH